MMKREDAVEKLQRQLSRIDEIKGKSLSSSDFEEWQKDTEIAITQIFGEDTIHLKDFNTL